MFYRALPRTGLGLGVLVVGALVAFVTWRSAHRARPGVAPVSADHRPARIALGRKLFFDQSLSDPAGTSCASCHDPVRAFAGNHGSTIGVAQGSRPGHFARRNTPSVLYLKFVRRFHYHWEEDAPLPDAVGGFFWDGRSDSLAALVEQPFSNPDEMNGGDRARLARALAAAPYAADLRREFGTAALATAEGAFRAFGQSLEAFLTSDELSPFSSRYDDYIRGRATLTATELRGLALFRNPEKGNCGSCHRFNPDMPDPTRSLFTDYGYETLAVPRNNKILANGNPTYADIGLCERNDPRSHTDDPRLCGSFRTPSLRNVAVRENLMHNGVFTRLRDAVAFYATRASDPGRWYRKRTRFDDLPARYHRYVNERLVPYDRGAGQTPRLDDDDIDAIVAFLQTLTDAPYREVGATMDRKSDIAFRRSESAASTVHARAAR